MKFLNYYLGVNIFNERRERLSPSFHYLQCYSVVNRESKGHLILQLEKVKCLISVISHSKSITIVTDTSKEKGLLCSLKSKEVLTGSTHL